MNEKTVSNKIRLIASKNNAVLWRNNVGCFNSEKGYVRYGLANESKKMNSSFKSSDLIGITAIEITPDMVGQTVGVFTAVEVKKKGWEYKGTAREKAQLAFLNYVRKLGGIGIFSDGENSQ
jgi:hypothetical protein